MKLNSLRVCFFVAVIAALIAPAASYTKKPPPGGANQMKAIGGKFGTWVFNGRWRLKITAYESVPHQDGGAYFSKNAENHWIVFRGLLRNGTSAPAKTWFASVWANDADGVAHPCYTLVNGPPPIQAGDVVLPPGGATPLRFPCEVPLDFKPVSLLMVPGFSESKPFRIGGLPAPKIVH